PLGTGSPAWLAALLDAKAPAPLAGNEIVRAAIRDLLRHGGYKPTRRGKPLSEDPLPAAAGGAPAAIQAAADAGDAVWLHSGLPISVVDFERLRQPLSIAGAGAGAAYEFNAAGQTIALDGLPCLCDADGPCANAVKDAQRTKTHAGTARTLSVIWGSTAL